MQSRVRVISLCFMWSQMHGFSFTGRPEKQRLGGRYRRKKKQETRKRGREVGARQGYRARRVRSDYSICLIPTLQKVIPLPRHYRCHFVLHLFFSFSTSFNLFTSHVTQSSGGSRFVPGELVEHNRVEKLDSYRRDSEKRFLSLWEFKASGAALSKDSRANRDEWRLHNNVTSSEKVFVLYS